MLVLKGYEENSRSNNRFLDRSSSIVLFGSNCEPLSQIVPAYAEVAIPEVTAPLRNAEGLRLLIRGPKEPRTARGPESQRQRRRWDRSTPEPESRRPDEPAGLDGCGDVCVESVESRAGCQRAPRATDVPRT